ncbi:MAG: nucleotide exchange factor GrpE [Pseudomonadota bacterium]
MEPQDKVEEKDQPPQQPMLAKESEGETVSEGMAPVAPSNAVDDKLASAEAKAAEMEDAFLRAKAELENLRRRAREDITRTSKFAIEGFAESLVPVKDSLETALRVDSPSVDSLKQGVQMTLKQMETAFEKNSLTEINPVSGEKLDPMKHQAISMVPAEQNPNTIISVLQKGYMIADRLLRPALVTVAQEKQDEKSTDSQ